MQKYICKFIAMFLLCYCNYSVALIMNEDTTWTLDKSPYKLAETLQIAPGVTLTIESGVEVIGTTIQNFGNVFIKGDRNNPVIIRDSNLSVFKGATTYGFYLIDNAYITNTSIYRSPYTSVSSGKLIITNSIIQDNPYIYLWYPESDCLFEGNIFINSGPVSVGTHGNVNVTLKNNFFYEPTTHAIDNWASYYSSLTNVEKK